MATELGTELKDLQQQIDQLKAELAASKVAAPSAAPSADGPPAWVRPQHAAELVRWLVAHGDQPRGGPIDLGNGVTLQTGVRHAYLCTADGPIAALPVHWSDLG